MAGHLIHGICSCVRVAHHLHNLNLVELLLADHAARIAPRAADL